MTNAKLNELLEIAKESQAQWDKWESEGEYDRSPSWKPLYRKAQDAMAGTNLKFVASIEKVDAEE